MSQYNYAVFLKSPKFCPECQGAISNSPEGTLQDCTFVAVHNGSMVHDHSCRFRFKVQSSTPQQQPPPNQKWQIQFWDGKKWLEGAPFSDEKTARLAFEKEAEQVNKTQKRAFRLVAPNRQIHSETIGSQEQIPAAEQGRVYAR